MSAPELARDAAARWPWLRASDPDRTVLHRALRVAIVTPALFAFGLLVLRDAQFALLTCFGSFAALAMADFTGPRVSRLSAYATLGALGVVLVTVGTLLSNTLWPAVVAMLVVGLVFQFLMVMGGQFALGNNAVILAFVIAVMVPADASTLGSRLAGWIVAIVCSAVAATFLWPRHERRDLHEAVVAASRTLAVALREGARGEDIGASLAACDDAMTRVRDAQAAVGFRPVGPPEHQRALMGIVDALGQAVRFAHVLPAVAWSAADAVLATAIADALDAIAMVTDASMREVAVPAVPIDALATARHVHRAHVREAGEAALAAGEAGVDVVRFARDAFIFRVLSYDVLGMAVDAAVMSRRPVAVRDDFAVVEPAVPSTVLERWTAALVPQLTLKGVWLRNCMRAGVALALAVLVAKVSDIGHAFWVVLATLSVLRGNASTTRATVVSAVLGALVGLVLATLAMLAIGPRADILWLVLPLTVFLAGYAPAAISFGVGQAMFALLVVILFNLIVPEGWEVGVVRVEAVGLGAAVALVASLIMWPRGAADALRQELAASLRAAAALMADGFGALAGRVPVRERALHDAALAARERVDVAMAAYMGERGVKRIALPVWQALARVPLVLRVAGDAAFALARSGPVVIDAHPAAMSYLAAVDAITRSVGDMADALEGRRNMETALGATLQDLAAPYAHSNARNAILAQVGRWLDDHRQDATALERATAFTWGTGWLGYLAHLRLSASPALMEITGDGHAH